MVFSNDCDYIKIETSFCDAVYKKRRQRVKRKTRPETNETKAKPKTKVIYSIDDVNSSEQFNTQFTQLGRIGFLGRQSLEIEERTDRASKSYRNLTAGRLKIEADRDSLEQMYRDHEEEVEEQLVRRYRQLKEEREEQWRLDDEAEERGREERAKREHEHQYAIYLAGLEEEHKRRIDAEHQRHQQEVRRLRNHWNM